MTWRNVSIFVLLFIHWGYVCPLHRVCCLLLGTVAPPDQTLHPFTSHKFHSPPCINLDYICHTLHRPSSIYSPPSSLLRSIIHTFGQLHILIFLLPVDLLLPIISSNAALQLLPSPDISQQLPHSNLSHHLTSPTTHIACHRHVTQSLSVPGSIHENLSHQHPSQQHLWLHPNSHWIISHSFILVTNYPRLCTYLQKTSYLLQKRLNTKEITQRLDTSLETRPGYRVIISALIILSTDITMLAASSDRHFSPLPSNHPPISTEHHNFIATNRRSTTHCMGKTLQSLQPIAAPTTIHSSYLSIHTATLLHEQWLLSLSFSLMIHSLFSPCHPTVPTIKIYRRCPPIGLDDSLQNISMLPS